jgi:hypothetical protein
MQSSFAKPLDRSFVDFFAKTGMQSPFAKPLELLCLDAQKHPKTCAQYPSHQIFRRMHGALNIDKINN